MPIHDINAAGTAVKIAKVEDVTASGAANEISEVHDVNVSGTASLVYKKQLVLYDRGVINPAAGDFVGSSDFSKQSDHLLYQRNTGSGSTTRYWLTTNAFDVTPYKGLYIEYTSSGGGTTGSYGPGLFSGTASTPSTSNKIVNTTFTTTTVMTLASIDISSLSGLAKFGGLIATTSSSATYYHRMYKIWLE